MILQPTRKRVFLCRKCLEKYYKGVRVSYLSEVLRYGGHDCARCKKNAEVWVEVDK